MSQNRLKQENSTSSLPNQEELIQPKLTESTQEPIDTCSFSVQKQRTVPSFQIEGTIWLRYAPKE
jgi:hypothetical protein